MLSSASSSARKRSRSATNAPGTQQRGATASKSDSSRVFKHLLETGKWSDATVVVKGVNFSVHRAVLASRSSAFEKMFGIWKKKAGNGPVVIEDIEPEIFQQVLNFVYSGNSEITLLTVVNIWLAAIKYELPDLKLRCEQFLENELEMDYVADVLKLIEQYQLPALKSICIDYLVKRRDDIPKEIFNKIESINPAITYELFRKIPRVVDDDDDGGWQARNTCTRCRRPLPQAAPQYSDDELEQQQYRNVAGFNVAGVPVEPGQVQQMSWYDGAWHY